MRNHNPEIPDDLFLEMTPKMTPAFFAGEHFLWTFILGSGVNRDRIGI